MSVNSENTSQMLKEYLIDFDTGEFLLDNENKFIIVEGLEAVQVRCWIKLKIQKNRYIAYMNEGSNIKSLVGKDLSYVNKNIQIILNETLIDNIYIKSVDNIQVAKDGDKFNVEFTINSIYGSYSREESW